MKKTRVILACLALALAFGGLTGCMLPDYQLDMDVTITTVESTYSIVSYTLTNVGSRDLSNVQLEIEVYRTGVGVQLGHLGPFNIRTGNSTTGSVTYSWSEAGTGDEVIITSVGWDADD